MESSNKPTSLYYCLSMTFHQFAASFGIIVDRIYPCDRIQRVPTVSNPNKKNAAVYWDGRRGWGWVWGEVEKVQWWNDPDSKPWTDAEKREWARKRREALEDKARRQREAAEKAEWIMSESRNGTHPYLAYKGFPDERAMVVGDDLIIPMRDLSGKHVLGLQYVTLEDNEWKKLFLPGQKSTGAVFAIGDEAPETILCEGYATGLSIALAVRKMGIRMRVVCCFSAHNIQAAAPMLEGRRFVFADNDRSGTGQRVAQETGLPWVTGDNVGEDANDLHRRAGIMAVMKKIHEARKML